MVPRGTNIDYIKRVVALPGDRIALKNGQIILNGHPVRQAMEPPIDLPLDALASDEDPTPCGDGLLSRKPSGAIVCELPVLRETMPNGASYTIIEHSDQPQDTMHEIRVPQGHVFLMGDNRDHSADSRFSLEDRGLGGPVPLSDIGGRAEFLTFSLDETVRSNPLTWLGALRKHRAWRTLRPPLDHGGTIE